MKNNFNELDKKNYKQLKINESTELKNIKSSNQISNYNNIIIKENFIYKKIGKTYCFFSNKNGDPIIIIGPQYYMFIIFSSLVNGIVYLFLNIFWNYYSKDFRKLGIILTLIFQFFYTITFLINPGYPKNTIQRQTGEPREKYKFCGECKFWVEVEKNVNHCYDCDICVEGYDHHCPWTSKCIGRRNKISFYGFMTTILIIFGYFIFMITNTRKLNGNK
jgi:hypothetical protein